MENIRFSLFFNFVFLGVMVLQLLFTYKYLLPFTGNAPLIFYFELIFCFEAVFKNSYLILISFFSCYNISILVTYLTIKHIYILRDNVMCLVLVTVLSRYSMTSSNNLTFLTNNVKGLQSSKKTIKLIEYFRSKLNDNGFLFLQETHSAIKNKDTWVNDFNGPGFFSHGTSYSCNF